MWCHLTCRGTAAVRGRCCGLRVDPCLICVMLVKYGLP